jgi:hypothetical protein
MHTHNSLQTSQKVLQNCVGQNFLSEWLQINL